MLTYADVCQRILTLATPPRATSSLARSSPQTYLACACLATAALHHAAAAAAAGRLFTRRAAAALLAALLLLQLLSARMRFRAMDQVC